MNNDMWVIPSRSRPDNIARLVRAWYKTYAVAPVLLRLDKDDPMIVGYSSIDYPSCWTVSVLHRTSGLSEIYNEVFYSNPKEHWYGIGADDMVPETLNWDKQLIGLAGLDGVAFGDDGIYGPQRATHLVVGGDLVRKTGWLSLPGLKRLYIDAVWNDIARSKGVLRYQAGVRLVHYHFSNGKALVDGIYRKPDKAHDKEIYELWCKEVAAGP